MKKHNALKVVLVSMIVALVLSWIIPAAYFSTEFMGILSVAPATKVPIRLTNKNTIKSLVLIIGWYLCLLLFLVLYSSHYKECMNLSQSEAVPLQQKNLLHSRLRVDATLVLLR